jgi:hypothetical protein
MLKCFDALFILLSAFTVDTSRCQGSNIITLVYLLVPGEAMLGAFAKLRKTTVGAVVSVRPRGTLDGFA